MIICTSQIPACRVQLDVSWNYNHLAHRCTKRFHFLYFFIKKRVFNGFIFLGHKNVRYLGIICCEIVNRKYAELLIRANIYLNIWSFLHWLNYSIKVSVERWPHYHVRYYYISSFSLGPKWFCKQRFLLAIFDVFTLFVKSVLMFFILIMNIFTSMFRLISLCYLTVPASYIVTIYLLSAADSRPTQEAKEAGWVGLSRSIFHANRDTICRRRSADKSICRGDACRQPATNQQWEQRSSQQTVYLLTYFLWNL